MRCCSAIEAGVGAVWRAPRDWDGLSCQPPFLAARCDDRGRSTHRTMSAILRNPKLASHNLNTSRASNTATSRCAIDARRFRSWTQRRQFSVYDTDAGRPPTKWSLSIGARAVHTRWRNLPKWSTTRPDCGRLNYGSSCLLGRQSVHDQVGLFTIRSFPADRTQRLEKVLNRLSLPDLTPA